MIISIVVAVADNGVIGRDGALPWRISADLKTFRRLTMGKPLIMGRRTFQSLKKPLDGRDNIVLTHQSVWHPDGAIVAGSWLAALAEARRCAVARGVDEIMVIGGTAVFAHALASAHRIYKTEVHGRPAGDAFFPTIDWAQWEERSREALPRGPRDDHTATLIELERKGSIGTVHTAA
ncbi:MAG TPA: dihydrofolate reductase [Hyphomicrobium sp.]|jgi:dihydrofolate reductase